MFSKAIFRQTLKANIRMTAMISLITSLMMVVMVAVFEPATIKSVTSALGGSGLLHASGTGASDAFLSMLGSTFFAIHGILLPIIFIILTANSLLASQVDKGSMAYLLSTPTKRSTVVRTQAFFLIGALILMFLLVSAAGALSINHWQSSIHVDMTKYYEMMLGLFLLMFATSGISFFASSWFNLSKNSLLFGGGLPVAFFLFHLMSTMSSSIEGLKYLSLNTLFDTSAIIGGNDFILNFVIMGVVGLAFYLASLIVFVKKDLPL